MQHLPAPSTVKEIGRVGLPGILAFSRNDPLVVPINSYVKTLRIRIPDKGILNLRSLKLRTLGDALPPFKATMSSIHPDASQDPASLLTGTAAIHTQDEVMPWWQVQFETPVYIFDAIASNREGKWGARAYSIQFDWTDDSGTSWAFDNLGVAALQQRVQIISTQLGSLCSEILDRGGLASPQRERLGLFWVAAQKHLRQVRDAIQGVGVDLSALDQSRTHLLNELWEIGQTCDASQLQTIGDLFRACEAFLWNGLEPHPVSGSELDVAASILGLEFKEKGSVALARLFDVERLLGTEERVTRFEHGVQDTVQRLGGDISLFPIQLKAHGLHGSHLRKHEAKFVDAVRDVVGQLSATARPGAICYGTLLGVIREGRLLTHDDDVDVVFLANSTSEAALTEELDAIIAQLRETGTQASLEPGFLFLKIQARNGLFVDAFPVIRSTATTVRMYMEKLTIRDVPAGLVLPFKPMSFYDQDIAGPADPEGFLANRYGATWRTPDRFYGLPWNIERKPPA
jgi:hypothetical protein